jgi:hypothetical protein
MQTHRALDIVGPDGTRYGFANAPTADVFVRPANFLQTAERPMYSYFRKALERPAKGFPPIVGPDP